jgi:hypothetical protein
MDFSAVFGHAQYDGDHKKQTYHEVISILFFCPNIWGSCGCDYEDHCRLRCDAV